MWAKVLRLSRTWHVRLKEPGLDKAEETLHGLADHAEGSKTQTELWSNEEEE